MNTASESSYVVFDFVDPPSAAYFDNLLTFSSIYCPYLSFLIRDKSAFDLTLISAGDWIVDIKPVLQWPGTKLRMNRGEQVVIGRINHFSKQLILDKCRSIEVAGEKPLEDLALLRPDYTPLYFSTTHEGISSLLLSKMEYNFLKRHYSFLLLGLRYGGLVKIGQYRFIWSD